MKKTPYPNEHHNQSIQNCTSFIKHNKIKTRNDPTFKFLYDINLSFNENTK